MRTLKVSDFDSPPAIMRGPLPEVPDNHILLRVRACGLNFADLLMRSGRYQDTPDLPFGLGMEVAGEVVDHGGGTSSLAPGTRVAAFCGSGGLADFVSVPRDAVVPIPDAMPDVHAAAFLVAYGTSHLALTHRARLQSDETLLVLGAAGGVGLTAVEIGKLLGARVIAAARGPEKLEIAKKAGADHVIDVATADVKAEVRALGGADVVYDPVGGPLFEAALRSTNPDGRILAIGFASGTVPKIPANIILVKNISVIGFYWGGYRRFNGAAMAESIAALFGFYEEGRLKPHVSATYPLDEALQALDLLESRKSTGKIVVTTEDD
ncbi:MAG: NADPH:quinone oxidoreductase family protein [Pseudomonadota bacterium]